MENSGNSIIKGTNNSYYLVKFFSPDNSDTERSEHELEGLFDSAIFSTEKTYQIEVVSEK